MGDPGQHGGELGHPGGHLQGDIVTKVHEAGDLGQGSGPGHPGAVVVGALLVVIGDIVHGLLTAHDGSRLHGGVHQGLVAGAAADIAVLFEPASHLVPGGGGILHQQPVGRNDEARGAEAALDAAVGDPCQLQGVEMLGRSDALDGENIGEGLHLAHFEHAGADDLSVDQHAAGAADAGAAADLGAGEAQPPQHHGQAVLLPVVDHVPLDAVDDQRHAAQFLSMFHSIFLF